MQKGSKVIAAVDTQKGLSETVVPKGTTGKVLACRDDGQVLVNWKMKPNYVGDNRCSSHPKEHLTVAD